VRPDGSLLSEEVHRGFRWMSNSDARAIAAYLKSLPAEPGSDRGDTTVRDFGFLAKRTNVAGYVPEISSFQASEGYGRYLTLNVAGCQRCHSASGSSNDEDLLRGSTHKPKVALAKRLSAIVLTGEDPGLVEELPPELLSGAQDDSSRPTADSGEKTLILPPGAPNIRGREGLSGWEKADVVKYLTSGQTATGKKVDSDDCPWGSYRSMNDKDKQAIATYLKSL
jgi:cytochrome c553